MGDDLMRLFISYQLFRKDLSAQPGELNATVQSTTFRLEIHCHIRNFSIC